MKRFSRVFVSLMLAIIMSVSLFMLAACGDEVPGTNSGDGTSTSISAGENTSTPGGNSASTNPGDSTSSNPGDNSGSTNPGGGDDPQAGTYEPEDRSAYTIAGVSAIYLNASLYEIVSASTTPAGVQSLLKGYRLGDIYNSAIDMAAASSQEGEGYSPETMKAFKFTRGTDGMWRNAYTADVHPLFNKVLNFELDGSGEIGFTESELNTYANTSVLYLVKWSLNNSEITVNGVKTDVGNAKVKQLVEQIIDSLVAQAGGFVGATLNAKISDLNKMFNGEAEGVLNIYGALTMNELTSSEFPAPYGNLTFAQMYALSTGGSAAYVEVFGDYTFGELSEGAPIPEALASVTVKECYQFTQKLVNLFMTGDRAAAKELFGDTTVGQVVEMFGGEMLEEYANVTMVELFEVYATVYEIVNSEDQYAAFMEVFGKVTLGEVAQVYGVEIPEWLMNVTVEAAATRVQEVLTMHATRNFEAMTEFYGDTTVADIFSSFAEYMPEKLASMNYVTFVQILCEEIDTMQEVGFEAYTNEILINVWNRYKDMPLGALMEMVGYEFPEEYAEYAEVTLEEFVDMLQAEIAGPVEEEPVVVESAPKSAPVTEEENGENEDEEQASAYEIVKAVLSDYIVAYRLKKVAEGGEETHIYFLTAWDVVQYAAELFIRIDQSQVECSSFKRACEAVLSFIDDYDDEFTMWCEALDAMRESEVEFVPQQGPVYFSYEEGEYDPTYGDGDEYGEVDEPIAAPTFSFVTAYNFFKYTVTRTYKIYCAVEQMSIREIIYQFFGERIKVEVFESERLNAFSTALEKCIDCPVIDLVDNAEVGQELADALMALTVEDYIFLTRNGEVPAVPEDCGKANVDALSALFRKYYAYTLADTLEKKEEMQQEIAAAYAALTLNDILYMLGAEEDVPAPVAKFFTAYGEFTPAAMAAFDEEQTNALVKALEGLEYEMNMATLYPYLEEYDFGNENFKTFVLTVAALPYEDVIEGTKVYEAMKNVKVMDAVMAGMKMGSDFTKFAYRAYNAIKEYIEKLFNNNEDVLSDNNYFFDTFYYTGNNEAYTPEMVETMNEMYAGNGMYFYEGSVFWNNPAMNVVMFGEYDYDGYDLTLNIYGEQDMETGESTNYPSVMVYNGFADENNVTLIMGAGVNGDEGEYYLYASFRNAEFFKEYYNVEGGTFVYNGAASEGYADPADYEDQIDYFRPVSIYFGDDGEVFFYCDSDASAYKTGKYYQEEDTVFVTFTKYVTEEATTDIDETMTFTATEDGIEYLLASGTTDEGEYKVYVDFAPYDDEPYEGEDYLFLIVGKWNAEDAEERYAAYFFNKTNDDYVWLDMSESFNDVYYVAIPDGFEYVIFVRMNGKTEENNWDNKWNQTDDLSLEGHENDTYIITDWSAGKWDEPAKENVE